MRNYELIFIVRPELDEEGLNTLVARVQQIITEHGGQVAKAELLGRRKLAYPIKKQREGYYVLVQTTLEQPAIVELERMLKLSEDVLRHMMVLLDEAE